MFEPYLMGQYQYPWQGMTPMPNWQPQTPQSALCGVVRYPNSTTFTAGYNPYFNVNACGCGTTF